MQTTRKTPVLGIFCHRIVHSRTGSRSVSGLALALVSGILLTGCGGGGKGSPGSPDVGNIGRETVQSYGSLTTRVVGTAQAPVTSAGSDVTVTGVAGALFTDMTTAPFTTHQIAWNILNGADLVDIHLRNADGSGQEKSLIGSATANENPEWSPDGTKMVLSGWRNRSYEIVVRNVDGSGSEINVSNNPGDDSYPQWSPDGTKIVWEGIRNGNLVILVKNADGTGSETNVSQIQGTNRMAQWSPDGTKIVWVANPFGNDEIVVRNANGSGGITYVRPNPGKWDTAPQWSPDGTKIAWTSEGTDLEILVRSATGTGPVINVSNRSNHDYLPQWSPDGKQIAWHRDNAIRVKNADGTGSEIDITNDAESNHSAQWSPDGTKIAWVGRRGADHEILVKNASGIGPEINVSNNTYNDDFPQWSPVPVRQQTRLVGAGGSLGTTAAGFLIGQKGSTLGSVVTFDTAPATRANARVSAQTSPETNGPNVVFIVSAGDALTSLRYTLANGTQETATVIGASAVATTATHALVSFDASTGQVSLVMPYNANRSVDTEPEKAGDVMTFRGSFPAAFDGTGKNVAPNGATEVRINARTGEVVAIR